MTDAEKMDYLASLRPTREQNLAGIIERGESLDDIQIKIATNQDIDKLSQLHVDAWHETYPYANPPTFEIRHWQWTEFFNAPEPDSFVLVGELADKLIGFTRGRRFKPDELPGYDGELNKIYLLARYHRLGIGTRLLVETAKQFAERGMRSFALFGESYNPSIRFHEAMGGQRLLNPQGGFDGGYGWPDLSTILSHEEFCSQM